jgi:hypothetical protein
MQIIVRQRVTGRPFFHDKERFLRLTLNQALVREELDVVQVSPGICVAANGEYDITELGSRSLS